VTFLPSFPGRSCGALWSSSSPSSKRGARTTSPSELGPIHLLEDCYLADLEHAERRQGETFTGAQWTYPHYGPWAQEVHQRIEPALVAIHADKQLISSPKYDDDVVRWRKRDDPLYEQLERELPVPVVTSFCRNVRKYGKDTRELLHHVYATRPTRRAVPRGELVFLVAESVERSLAVPSRRPSLLASRRDRTRCSSRG
jgi:hypothetical protein